MVEGGSILHADHPRKWVIFARRFTDRTQERIEDWPGCSLIAPSNGSASGVRLIWSQKSGQLIK